MMSEEKNFKVNVDVNLKINLKINQKSVEKQSLKEQLEGKLDTKLGNNLSKAKLLPEIQNKRYHLNVRHQKYLHFHIGRTS